MLKLVANYYLPVAGFLHRQGCFALLPVAGAKLVGLQRVKHAQNFLRIASNREIGHVRKADDVLGIDDKGRALRTPAFSSIMPSWPVKSRLMSASIGNGRSFKSG